MSGGLIAICAVAFLSGAALYAYMAMRLTDERDPAIAAIMSMAWPLFMPFLLVFWAAKLGERR